MGCQRDIEGESKCKEQCDHCKEYYALMEFGQKVASDQKEIDPEIKQVLTPDELWKLI